MKTKIVTLAMSLIVSASAHADVLAPVFTCPADGPSYRLTVSYFASPGPLGGFSYQVTYPGLRTETGKLDLLFQGQSPGRTAVFTADDIAIGVDQVQVNLPAEKVLVRYTIHGESADMVCTKGPFYDEIF